MAAMGSLMKFLVSMLCLGLMFILGVSGLFVSHNGTIVLEDNSEIEINFDPPEITLKTTEDKRVYFNLTILTGAPLDGGDSEMLDAKSQEKRLFVDDIMIHVASDDPDNAHITGNKDFLLSDLISRNLDLELQPNSTLNSNNSLYFTIQGVFLGYARISFYVNNSLMFASDSTNSNITLRNLPSNKQSDASYLDLTNENDNSPEITTQKMLPISYKVTVVRKERIVDIVFIVGVTFLVFFSNMGMGCKVDLDVVKEIFKKPIAPSIGFCCQYIIMPLVSFAALTMMGLEGGIALGLFAAGCAPGGSGSNMYTFLLDGDVSLSITMTLVSTLASLFMIPLWLYTMGRLITEDNSHLQIPIANIFISLFCLLIPIAIGIIIRRKKPRVAQVFVKCLKPFFLVLIIFMFTFGIWTNLYVFRLITITLCIAGAFLPYVGFVLGGLVALACRQPRARIVTIAIETGLQNTGIPILLLKYSLPQPEADMSIISPITASMFTPIPLFIAVIVHEIRKRCCKKASKEGDLKENGLNNIDMPLTNGETLSDPEVSEDDLLTPDEAKLNSKTAGISRSKDSAKLVFNFDETNGRKK